jgi:hypothetical protein
MRHLAEEGRQIACRFEAGAVPTRDDREKLRTMALEARGLLTEAGYPGERVWRGLQRASMGADTGLDSGDPTFWTDVADDLEQGAATLESLTGPIGPRDVDFRIVG